MVKINNEKELNQYIEKYSMDEIFSKDMKPFMELLFFKKNEYMLREGERVNYLLFLVKGKAKVSITLSNGKSLLLCFYHEFMVLGDLEIIELNPATSKAQVIEDTYCIGIAIEKVTSYLLEDAKFLKFICLSLGGKLYQCSKNSSINLLYSLENRLASYIFTAAERIDDKGQVRIIFDENLTEISELLGTSYRHLLRTLNSLCTMGVIRKNEQNYEVINEETLKKLSADLYQ